jgi:hypothetical protein
LTRLAKHKAAPCGLCRAKREQYVRTRRPRGGFEQDRRRAVRFRRGNQQQRAVAKAVIVIDAVRRRRTHRFEAAINVDANRHVSAALSVCCGAADCRVHVRRMWQVEDDPPRMPVAAMVEDFGEGRQQLTRRIGALVGVLKSVEADLLARRQVESALVVVRHISVAQQSKHALLECNRDDVGKDSKMGRSVARRFSFCNIRQAPDVAVFAMWAA